MNNNFFKVQICALAMSLSACSTPLLEGAGDRASFRSPAAESVSGGTQDLGAAVHRFHVFVRGPEFNSTTCAPRLNSIYSELIQTSVSRFDRAKLSRNALDVVQELFEARLELRHKLGKLAAENLVTEACENAVRQALVAARFVDEYVAEWKLALPESSNASMPAWSGEFPYVLKAPGVSSTEFRSGDLLLSRGDAFVSAAIARVGDVQGHFSHLALVYVDEKTGKKWTVESLLETGVVVRPIEAYFADGKVRSVIFRHPDGELAKRAGKMMYDRASQAIAAGANIPYDYEFNLNDSAEVFCAEVATIAYRVASGGQLQLPLFESRMSAKHREFLDDIGMKVRKTFAPLDMEVDTRFELIAEWRDLARTEQSHRKDAVLTMMYDWMQRYHYVLDRDDWTRMRSGVLWELRRWPFFSDLLKSRFPKNMSTRTLGVLTSLGNVGETLLDDLTEKDLAYHRRNGIWMTPVQMAESLEHLRMDDFSLWEQWHAWQNRNEFHSPHDQEIEPRRPLFHAIFHSVDAE